MEKVMCGTCKSPSAPTAAVKSERMEAPDSLAEPNAGSDCRANFVARSLRLCCISDTDGRDSSGFFRIWTGFVRKTPSLHSLWAHCGNSDLAEQLFLEKMPKVGEFIRILVGLVRA